MTIDNPEVVTEEVVTEFGDAFLAQLKISGVERTLTGINGQTKPVFDVQGMAFVPVEEYAVYNDVLMILPPRSYGAWQA